MKQVTASKQVDIIIPVFNRLDHTRQTLQSLFRSTNPKFCNLYVIDDCSTDPKIEEFLSELQWDVKSTKIFFNKKNIGPGASRNKVCNWITEKKLRSKYLYHSDNDVYFKAGWLKNLIDMYEDSVSEGIRLLGGGCHPYLRNNASFAPNRFRAFRIGVKDAVSGFSQLMTWKTWDKYGPFDETMRGQKKKIMGSEDWAFCQKIVKGGFKVGSLEPEVVIQTGKTNTYGEPATGPETFKEVEGVMIK